MQPSTSSDSSNPNSILEGAKDELLDALDHARQLPDLIQSLKCQKAVIEALLILLEE